MRGGSGLPPTLVVPSASRASSSDSGAIVTNTTHTSDWGGLNSLTTKLVISAITGSIVVAIEHSDSAGSGYAAIDTYPSQNGTTTGIIRTAIITPATKQFVRVSWTIVTGPCTFSVQFGANPAQIT